MNLFRLCGHVALFAILPLVCANPLAANCIDNTGSVNSLDPGLIVDNTPGSALEGSFLLDGVNLGNLGLIPGSFLFGPNAFYDFTGNQVVAILSAIVDPGQTILPLNDPDTILVTFTFTGTSQAPDDPPVVASDILQDASATVPATTPEPAVGALLAVSSGLLIWYAAFRVRRVTRPVLVQTGRVRRHSDGCTRAR